MRRVMVVFAVAFTALTAHGQTRITSDVEIRNMEGKVRKATDFETRVSARINLGDLRNDRNESAAAEHEFEIALQLARDAREQAWRKHDLPRYGVACSWAGLALASLGRGAEAFAIFEEAVRYAPDSPGIWNNYSVAMSRLDRREKATGTGRLSVAAGERTLNPTPGDLLRLNVSRFTLAQGLLNSGDDLEKDEAERLLRTITASLDSDTFDSTRKAVGKREEFQILTAPTTDSGRYLSIFNRAHMQLALIYENDDRIDEARREYQAVVGRRSDEPTALAGLARLSRDAKERDQYLVQSLDANPFAADVVDEYQRHVNANAASPATPGGSVGSQVRLAIQQIHNRDFRRGRETLQTLLAAHPNNDVLKQLLANVELLSGANSGRPRFLDQLTGPVTNPSEPELRAVLSLFSTNKLSPTDRATLDRSEFSSNVTFDKPDGEAFAGGTINGIPFRFQSPTRFRGVPSSSKNLRVAYRILGATTVDGRDALLVEPLRVEVSQ